jgi:hypothetical protein
MAAGMPLDGRFRGPLNSFVADPLQGRVLAGTFRDEPCGGVAGEISGPLIGRMVSTQNCWPSS